ncbi:receptor-type tyrosine-protein phosphatase C [Sceloporus undulatus]|uniref:receptor-type tyrosine-protein phosphatase C n=1 Tax=Sceloporus undulatus TaxID=8520 RepID=UPI001C4CB5EF|nr:receptor-type tyrosine-protein phosphatase C [Sceloporus undulatus]
MPWWLKLLAFGLALVNVDVFGKDQKVPPSNDYPDETHPPSNSSLTTHMDSNSSSTQTFSSTAAFPPFSPSTIPHAPSDDLNNSSIHADSSASTDTPANISQAPADTTSGPIATPARNCDNISLSVQNYEDARPYVSANISIDGASDLQNVSCLNGYLCDWNKNTNKLTGLQECEEYEIKAVFPGCIKYKSIHVPPVRWKLDSKDVTDTSVTLIWNITNNSKCQLQYSYCCRPHDVKSTEGCNEKSSNPQKIIGNLSSNKNYSCTSQIYFENKNLNKTIITVETDFGKPGIPENVTAKQTNKSISISWEKPKNEINGQSYGYKVQIYLTDDPSSKPIDEKDLNATSYEKHNLDPFTNYTVRVWAYINSRNRSKKIEGIKADQVIQTEAAQPQRAKAVDASLLDNNVVKVTCREPAQLNGPDKIFILTWDGGSMNQRTCQFHVADLYYLKTYNFTVYVFNGIFYSEGLWKTVDTRYNAKALIAFLAFLIILTSLALLLVLYKIYTLNRERSRNSDEAVVLVPRDDERHLMSVEPIPAELLWEAYKRKIADEGRLFLDEFQSIPRVFSKFTIKDARKSYNQNKNRYVDILPYDYNRVELSAITSDPVKCAKYWPSIEEATACFGNIIVKINECKVFPDYIIQKLHITNRREKTTGRDVTHIQFTSWPDHGVPDEPHLLLKLRRRVNALSNFFSGPVVVHCSAGVGRTGTYIGIDAMLEGLESEGRVDVYGYVVKLRRQRCLMVQVEAQYILIHQALVEYIQYGETEVNISELHNYLNHLKKTDPPSDPSLLEAEFQRLPSYKNWQTQRAGKRDENKSKNRSSTVIPYDYNRVLFKHEEEGSRESENDGSESSDDESDCDEEPNKYINASFINGYWPQNAMIATQGPLPGTIADFWNMVYQRKVKVIVMLTELKDDIQELCAQYWGDRHMTYDGITVELKDVNNCSSYTIRTFDVTHVKRKEARKVFQYQYHKWKALDLPESPKDLFNMIQNLKQRLPPPERTSEAHVHSKNVQVVIHCRDGSQQTGMFCALMNLLESAETEGVIDVFQVVKALRKARPGIVSSFEDYQFLYDAIASIYPAQNGQVQKTQCQEHKIDIHNNEKKEEKSNSVAIDLCLPEQEGGNSLETTEDSKAKDGSREAASSSNGPTNQVLTEEA